MTLFETPRLIISELSLKDAPFILELLNQHSFIEYIGDRGVRSLADAESYLADGPIKSYAQHGFGLFRVALSAPDTPIGICGILKRDTLDYPDLGYALLERYFGQGYASEAAAATLDYARRELGMKRIVAVTAPDNHVSIRLLKKLGFAAEGEKKLTAEESESRYFVKRLQIE